MVHLLLVSIPLLLSFTIGLSLFFKSTCKVIWGWNILSSVGRVNEHYTSTSPPWVRPYRNANEVMNTSGISHYMWVHQTLQKWEEATMYHCKETHICAEGWRIALQLQHVCQIISKLDTSAELILIFINTIELSVGNPVFNLSLNLLSPPVPSLSGICKVKISLTNLRMKC